MVSFERSSLAEVESGRCLIEIQDEGIMYEGRTSLRRSDIVDHLKFVASRVEDGRI